MVLLHIKRGETSQFLYETSLGLDVSKLTQEIVAIYNGRLKIRRICAGLSRLFAPKSRFCDLFLSFQKWKNWRITVACCRPT